MPGEFIDSNVLLYSTASDPDKADRADQLIAGRPTVSVQVLNEAANVVRRKFGRQWPEIATWLGRMTPLLDVHPLTLDMHDQALRLANRYQLGWWDALIVAAALETACDTLWSEDMHHGLVVDGQLTIRNPFA